METLSIAALIGVPVALALGVIWATRFVFKDVSLQETPHVSQRVTTAEQRAANLGLELAIAEDLDADAATLNALQTQVTLAEENAERARQSHVETAEQEVRRPAPFSFPVQALSPIAAVHSTKPRRDG